MALPSKIKRILWDVDCEKIDMRKHKGFVIARIAEKGSWEDVKWLKKNYSLPVIKKYVLQSKNTSPKVKNFWKII